MFASLSDTPRRPFGRGALLSLAAHAAILAIALFLSPKSKTDDRTKPPEMRIIQLAAKAPPAAASPAGPKDPPKRTARAASPSEHAVAKPPVREAPAAQRSNAQAAPAAETAQGLDPSRAGTSDGRGIADPPVPSDPPGSPAVAAYEAIPFGAGMEEPRLVLKTDVKFSAKAWAMKIGGVALARCTIELDGSLSDCRITHSLPYMDDEILEALRAWRYTPVLYQGHPQRVIMMVKIRIAPPR